MHPTKTSEKKIRQLSLDSSPMTVAAGLAHLPNLVFLDSSTADVIANPGAKPRHSIISANPSRILTGNINHPTARAALRQSLEENRISGMDLGFPLGGLIGSIDYEGDYTFGEYPEMLIFDHTSDRWFEVGRLSDEIRDLTEAHLPDPDPPTAFHDSVSSSQYCSMVERAREYIAAGDIYQVNLSHRLEARWNGGRRKLLSLYHRLRQVSPAPYSAFLDLGKRTILSSSPEQFLRISGRSIETRPIKGTRPRFPDRDRDEKSAYDLITSSKEISELIMITDLERNDLGQICEFGSIQATGLLKLERFAQVFHLVSTIQGTLREEVNHVDALAQCFPGGSITGAPKRRAREIIDELETTERGPYTGSLGCFGFNGESLFNITIRTLICETGSLYFHTGAGIVADSVPEQEWEETLHKAAGILRTMGASVIFKSN